MVEFNKNMALETESKVLDPDILKRGVQQALAKPELCRYYVAEYMQAVIGQVMITYEWSDWRNSTIWWLQSVYVHPDYRARGVFRGLFQHIASIVKESQETGLIRLYVKGSNNNGQSVYQTLGFDSTGYLVFERPV